MLIHFNVLYLLTKIRRKIFIADRGSEFYFPVLSVLKSKTRKPNNIILNLFSNIQISINLQERV